MKLSWFIFLLPIPAFAESFEDRANAAREAMKTEAGAKYEIIFRESTWEKDHECFTYAAANGGAIGYYQIVANVKKDGSASNVEVRPNHVYSECVYNWFIKNKFHRPPTDNWPVVLEVDIQS